MININNLSKSFGKIKALDNLSLSIPKNELFGLLGPNGAGKTTLINILNTFHDADEGKVCIDGREIPEQNSKIKKLIGNIPQDIAIYEELTGWENLLFWGNIYGISKKYTAKRAEELLHSVGLYERRNDPVKNYSGGMKRRINIAAGLLHDPQIILFDEPTVGVDPQSRNFIFEMILDLHKSGKTIIYTTHYMEEVEKLCTKIGIIDSGKLIAQGTKEYLYKLLGDNDHVQITFNKSVDISKFDLAKEVKITKLDDFSISLEGVGLKKDLSKILSMVQNTSFEVADIQIIQPSLEQVFLSLTGKELRE